MKGWEHVTAAQILGRQVKPKPAKYRNVKVQADGHVFDSKHELLAWRDLQARQAAGEISELKHHPEPVELMCPKLGSKVLIAVCRYEPDFEYFEEGRYVIADAKSPATRKNAIYALKKKWLQLQEQIEIVEL